MQWLAVALGGSVGALCRYGVALSLPHIPGKFPLATFSANVFGSFLMGVLYVVIVEKEMIPIVYRQLLMVGFLGALTTFSTFSMESVQLLHTGHWKLALVYLLSSMLTCVLAAFLGYTIVEKVVS